VTTTISPEDFGFLRDLVLREAAIVLESGKEYLATSRLEPVARQEGLDGISGLVRALRANPNGKLREQVVDAMTTNETLWFRDAHPFASLEESIIPQLMEARKATRTLDIWCAAASTGQEPYTIAMVMKERFPQLAGWRVRILGTDISPSALQRARTGRYTQMEMGRGMPAKYMVKYFTRQGVDWQISEDIRRMVDYKLFNLAGAWPPMGPFDLVFIRNVLIYFNQQTKADIVNRAEKNLRRDGTLFLGSTESLLNIQTNLDRVQHGKTTCYRPKSA
jgi:chemotaxis protein methyltransferase CheR